MAFDIPRHLGAVSRIVTVEDREGKPAEVVVAGRTYDTDVEDLWDALTSEERIPRWFLPISGDLQVGGRFQLEGNAGGEIVRCEPPELLAVTWEYGENTSWVEVRLTAEGDTRSRLELKHTAHVPEEWQKQYGPGATGVGWDQALLGLALHVESNAAMDPAAAAAWLGSPEGRAFVEGSSDAWATASIEAGTDEEQARAAAARTTAFYTGDAEG